MKEEREFNSLDEALKSHGLSFSELDFESKSPDLIEAYKRINQTLETRRSYNKNIKFLFKEFNYRQAFKPVIAAAVISVIILFAAHFHQYTKPPAYTTIKVDAGEKITLHISNNISVWLNAESELRMPMKPGKNPTFYLSGEAYFEFTPSAGRGKIKVVSNNLNFQSSEGSFHIHSEYKNNQLVAHVSSGNVVLSHPELPKSERLMLTEGAKVSYLPNADFISVEKSNSRNYLAWKTGRFKFENTLLTEAIEALSSYFYIPFSIENEALEYKKFSGVYEKPALDEILNEISTNLNCNISGDGSKIIIN